MLYNAFLEAEDVLDELAPTDDTETHEEVLAAEIEKADEFDNLEEALDAGEEIVEVAEATESLLGQMATLAATMEVVKEYGYTQAIAELINANESLSQALNVALPATESLSDTASKYDTTVAILEEAAEKKQSGAWAKIKAGIKWLWNKLVEFKNKIVELFKKGWEKLSSKIAFWKKKSVTDVVVSKALVELSKTSGPSSEDMEKLIAENKKTATAVASFLKAYNHDDAKRIMDSLRNTTKTIGDLGSKPVYALPAGKDDPTVVMSLSEFENAVKQASDYHLFDVFAQESQAMLKTIESSINPNQTEPEYLRVVQAAMSAFAKATNTSYMISKGQAKLFTEANKAKPNGEKKK